MNFYVDCMPTEHAAMLDAASLERMVRFASNDRKRFPQVLAAPHVLEGILGEVRQDYVRAHNLSMLLPRKGEQGDALFVAPDAEAPVARYGVCALPCPSFPPPSSFPLSFRGMLTRTRPSYTRTQTSHRHAGVRFHQAPCRLCLLLLPDQDRGAASHGQAARRV